VPGTKSPARLVVALSVAAVLAVFLLYVSLFGRSTPSIQPSELGGRSGDVLLAGRVVGSISGDAERGYRFWLRDVDGTSRVRVVYRDSLPDQFKVGRDIALDGRLSANVFVGKPDTLVTKCPSKYTDKPEQV
jgi:cytochrome c-type biogenesis protein CcmE